MIISCQTWLMEIEFWVIMSNLPFFCKSFPMKLSFEFADRLDFHFKTFIAIPHMFCVCLCLNCLKIPIIITQKLPLTCAWFYEKGFKWPEPGYGSNHSSMYSCTMPPKTKGAKWPNWVEVAWKFRNSKIKFFHTLDIYL